MMILKNRNFNWSFLKTYGVVNAKTPYARNYKRPIKGGMSVLEATWKAHYMRTPIEFRDFG
ncbi:MAG: hypothetical protein V1685_07035 [Parcubacteria group bacterium]